MSLPKAKILVVVTVGGSTNSGTCPTLELIHIEPSVED